MTPTIPLLLLTFAGPPHPCDFGLMVGQDWFIHATHPDGTPAQGLVPGDPVYIRVEDGVNSGGTFDGLVFVWALGAGGDDPGFAAFVAEPGDPVPEITLVQTAPYGGISLRYGATMFGKLVDCPGDPGGPTYKSGFGASVPVTVPADVTRDLHVNTEDVSRVIAKWGTADPYADVNDDGIVNTVDLGLVVEGWTP